MACLLVDDIFQQSYEDFKEYPKNLIYGTTYQRALEAYKLRLEDAAPILCLADDDTDVGFRDFESDGRLFFALQIALDQSTDRLNSNRQERRSKYSRHRRAEVSTWR